MGAKLNGRTRRVNESKVQATILDTACDSPHSHTAVTRSEFIALNLVGGVCALLILCDVGLGLLNSRLNQGVAATQAQFGQAQQLQNTAQNLVVRVAQAGQTDPALRALLAKHEFKVNLNTNNPARPPP